jgi:endonuclease VIII
LQRLPTRRRVRVTTNPSLLTMPEGPEIFLASRAVNAAVAQQPIKLTLLHPALQPKARALRGVQIARVRARSKAMLTEFSNGLVLYSHNQLYGEWVVHKAGEALLKRQVRLVIHTAQHQVVLYSATDFAWLQAGAENAHPYIAKLGPEVLDAGVSAAHIAQRLAQFPRRVIADALLDQHVLAGLGNYLRADILFVARIDPLRKIGHLTAAELLRIAKACKLLTQRSVRRAGVTWPWAQYLATRSGLGYEASRFYAFDREGAPCWDCAVPIARTTQGGRGLFFCPQCQSGTD